MDETEKQRLYREERGTKQVFNLFEYKGSHIYLNGRKLSKIKRMKTTSISPRLSEVEVTFIAEVTGSDPNNY